MTLEEAIDRNVELTGELIEEERWAKARAIKLGIEALKDKVKARRHGHAYSSRLLPGETKE